MKSSFWKFWLTCAAAVGLLVVPSGCQSSKLSFPKLTSWAPTPPKWLSKKKDELSDPPPSMHFEPKEMQANNGPVPINGGSGLNKPSTTVQPTEMAGPKSNLMAKQPPSVPANSPNLNTPSSSGANLGATSTNGGNQPFRLSQQMDGFTQPQVSQTPPATNPNGSGAIGSSNATNNAIAGKPNAQPSRELYQVPGANTLKSTANGLAQTANSTVNGMTSNLEGLGNNLKSSWNQSAQEMKGQVTQAANEAQQTLRNTKDQISSDLHRKVGDSVQNLQNTVTSKTNELNNAISNMNPLGGTGEFQLGGRSTTPPATANANTSTPGQFGGFSNPTSNTPPQTNPNSQFGGGTTSGLAGNSGSASSGDFMAKTGTGTNNLPSQNMGFAGGSSGTPMAGGGSNNLNANPLGPIAATPPATSLAPATPMATTPPTAMPPANAFPGFSTPPGGGSSGLASSPPNAFGPTGNVAGNTATPNAQIGTTFPLNGNQVRSATTNSQPTTTAQPATYTAELPPELLNRSGGYAPGSTRQQ